MKFSVMPDDYCLMAPKEDTFSSISDVDFATLKVSEITPEIAGQWLFNVKGFSIDYLLVRKSSDPEVPDEVITGENTALVLTNPYTGETEGLRTNPQLRFIAAYAEDQKLNQNTNNDLIYSLGGELGYDFRVLELFYFVKNRDKWYVGRKDYSDSAHTYEISATLYSLTTSVTSFFEDAAIISEKDQQTYTITETFY